MGDHLKQNNGHMSCSGIRRQSLPILFTVILPGWQEISAWKKLSSSEFLLASTIIAAKDHGYVSGAQHQRRDRYLEAPFDTGVFVLANAQGKEKFAKLGGVEKSDRFDEFELELRKSFAIAVPT